MQYTIMSENPLSQFLMIDDWYNPNEEKAIWTELDFYNALPKQYQKRTEDSLDAAKEDDGSPKAKAYRYYPTEYYRQESFHISHILNCIHKVKEEPFTSFMEKMSPLNRMFYGCRNHNTMVTYYDSGDLYKPHIDEAAWTLCIWMLKDNDKINGGKFRFLDSGIEVELKHNRAVMFPSYLLHEVDPITCLDSSGNYGKYTITHFFSF